MRSLILSATALAVSLPVPAEPSDMMGVTVSGLTRRTVFLASPATGDAVAMPVLRICNDAGCDQCPPP